MTFSLFSDSKVTKLMKTENLIVLQTEIPFSFFVYAILQLSIELSNPSNQQSRTAAEQPKPWEQGT